MSSLPSAFRLGLFRTLQFSDAPSGMTFYYAKRKNEEHLGHLPVITSGWEDERRFRKTEGPFVYAVVDSADVVRYIGKSWEKYLHQRWLRPQSNIHHRESRDHILSELTAGRGPLHLWSATAAELKRHIPHHQTMPDRTLVAGIEAQWVARWFQLLWNNKLEPQVPGFDDREYWRGGS
jgi:hypothetical protein